MGGRSASCAAASGTIRSRASVTTDRAKAAPGGAWRRSRGARSGGALERGQVALGQPELAGLEQPAHHRAVAGVRQVLVEVDLLGCQPAEPAAAEGEQLAAQVLGRLEAGSQRHE